MTIEAISTVMTSTMNTYYVKESKEKQLIRDRQRLNLFDDGDDDSFTGKIKAAEGAGKDASGKGDTGTDSVKISISKKDEPSPAPSDIEHKGLLREKFTKSVYEYRATDNAYRRRLAMEAYS